MGLPKSVALSCFLYRVVLRLAPSTFRMEFQPLLLSDFRQLCLTAHVQAGAVGILAILPYHMLRTFCDISEEHFGLVKAQIYKVFVVFYKSLKKSAHENTETNFRVKVLVIVVIAILYWTKAMKNINEQKLSERV